MVNRPTYIGHELTDSSYGDRWRRRTAALSALPTPVGQKCSACLRTRTDRWRNPGRRSQTRCSVVPPDTEGTTGRPTSALGNIGKRSRQATPPGRRALDAGRVSAVSSTAPVDVGRATSSWIEYGAPKTNALDHLQLFRQHRSLINGIE